MSKTIRLVLLITSIAAVAAVVMAMRQKDFDKAEWAMIQSLALTSLEPLPADPTNRFADDTAAASFGKQLFFDTGFSGNGNVSCGTCHLPDRQFQDDVDRARGVGTTDRRTMPIAGTAYSPWFFWDGRKDSQWAQALGPLENPVEHGTTRGQVVQRIEKFYAARYREVFGSDAGFSDTTRVFVNMGKAIAAFERTIQFEKTRFDGFAETGTGFTKDEIAGLKLFIGKANCTQCHNGALLTDNVFHNTGVPERSDVPKDFGRALGAIQVLEDEFNCKSRWSDAQPGDCAELEYMNAYGAELRRAYKTPSLRGVASRPPYMHAGQIRDLSAVLDHYNRAPAAPEGHTEIKPLGLSAKELRQLEAYLHTLE